MTTQCLRFQRSARVCLGFGIGFPGTVIVTRCVISLLFDIVALFLRRCFAIDALSLYRVEHFSTMNGRRDWRFDAETNLVASDLDDDDCDVLTDHDRLVLLS